MHCGVVSMKKTSGFIACSIALTVLFYMLAYYLLPPPPPSAAMVLLFAAVAMVITWAIGAGWKKFRARGTSTTTTHLLWAIGLLGFLSVLMACSWASAPTATPASSAAPPPPAEGPPPAADGMPRVTGTAVLLPDQKEQPGYGLYSYALLSYRPQAAELPKFNAYLRALLELPTAAAVERYVPRRRINITYLPLETLSPAWDTLSTDGKVGYVVDHYDYARGTAMLASLRQRMGPGPVIISVLKPLDLSGHPHPVLVQDLTSAEPSLMATYVSHFVDQAAKDRFWQESTLSRFGLSLRNGLEVAAEGLGMSKSAVDTWVKYFK